MSPVILTHSGLHFNLLDPQPESIQITDIAHALSHICRFTGHTKEFYSVAEHSYLTSYLVEPTHALEALLHDAAEAYIGDVSSPLKSLLPDYKAIEERVEQAIRTRFALPEHQHPCVKDADLSMLATEKRDLMPTDSNEWELLEGVTPTAVPLLPTMTSSTAARLFLNRFWQLAVEAT